MTDRSYSAAEAREAVQRYFHKRDLPVPDDIADALRSFECLRTLSGAEREKVLVKLERLVKPVLLIEEPIRWRFE